MCPVKYEQSRVRARGQIDLFTRLFYFPPHLPEPHDNEGSVRMFYERLRELNNLAHRRRGTQHAENYYWESSVGDGEFGAPAVIIERERGYLLNDLFR